VDGKHHLGDAVAARLGREAVDERAVEEAADDRHDEDDEGAEEGRCGLVKWPSALGSAWPTKSKVQPWIR
jgi:hypothetical protein